MRESIKTSDHEAVEKLMQKQQELIALQEKMKAANSIIRSKKLSDSEKRQKMAEAGFSPKQYEVLKEPDFCGRIGFADYKLTNNGAEIRRLEKRITLLMKQRSEIVYKEIDHTWFREVHNPKEGRLQLLFEMKPSEGTRELLKKRGFKWSPSNGAWQRLLSFDSINILNSITDKIIAHETAN